MHGGEDLEEPYTILAAFNEAERVVPIAGSMISL